jgi:UDP-N-acetylglucosamine--N-acetylmuramyl-(pentapeptide) pyrophosphoryl-undecaprenol N-acetylglucosamine transferase
VNFSDVQQRWPGSVLTGMPIRKSLASVVSLSDRKSFRKLHAESWGFSPELPIVAIFGGSQGSAHINQVVAEFVKNGSDIQIIHAVGINNQLPPSQKNYLPVPYFHDMAAIYGSADLLVTRSGAVTCSELSALGKYAILVPLPHGNGEQVDNAKSLVNKGAGFMVANAEFSAHWLQHNLSSAIKSAMSFSSSPDLTNIHAATRIADLVLGLVP